MVVKVYHSLSVAGYKVITFKNPYLGNTCVPFQHWACSLQCAQSIEIPARLEQIAAARELDRQYDAYVRDCQRHYSSHVTSALRFSVRNLSSSTGNQCSVSHNAHASQTSLHSTTQPDAEDEDDDVGSVASSCVGTVTQCRCSIS